MYVTLFYHLPEDVIREYFNILALFICRTETNVIYKCAIAAAAVRDEDLVSVSTDYGVGFGQDLQLKPGN